MANAGSVLKAKANRSRRGEILQIAAQLLAERGFETTTMREIGAAANILSGSIYYHFSTKEEMLHEIVRDVAGGMAERARRIASASEEPEAKVAALILLSFEELFSDQEAFAILYNERQFFRRTPSFDYVVAAKGAVYDAWKQALLAGIDDGRFRMSLDMFMTIATIIRMLNTCADWYRRGAEHERSVPVPTRDDLLEFNLTFIFEAIRAPAHASEPVPRAAAERLLRAHLTIDQRGEGTPVAG